VRSALDATGSCGTPAARPPQEATRHKPRPPRMGRSWSVGPRWVTRIS